jgi:hypothetical protein
VIRAERAYKAAPGGLKAAMAAAFSTPPGRRLA